MFFLWKSNTLIKPLRFIKDLWYLQRTAVFLFCLHDHVMRYLFCVPELISVLVLLLLFLRISALLETTQFNASYDITLFAHWYDPDSGAWRVIRTSLCSLARLSPPLHNSRPGHPSLVWPLSSRVFTEAIAFKCFTQGQLHRPLEGNHINVTMI